MAKNKNAENKNYKQRFQNGFNILTRSKSPYKVWSDLMLLYATCLQNSCTQHYLKSGNEKLISVWNNREQQYINTITAYTEKEQKIIMQMFVLLIWEYELYPYQDLLGSIYMSLGIQNKNQGQFFTPYDLCKLSANVTIDKKTMSKAVKEKGYASICDPTVGGGAMLIASAERCNKIFNKLQYRNHVCFVGQDLDATCCHMCYIQLSLIGLAGYIVNANTLTTAKVDFYKDNEKIWITPYYNSDVWQGRILFHNLGMLMEGSNNV
jgi:hypothetical protein